MAKNIGGRFVAWDNDSNKFPENRRGTKSYKQYNRQDMVHRRLRNLSSRQLAVAWKRAETLIEDGDLTKVPRVVRIMALEVRATIDDEYARY